MNLNQVIVKYNMYGEIIWQTTYAPTVYGEFLGVSATSGGYLVVGEEWFTDFGSYVVKFDLNGNFLWKKNVTNTKYYYSDVVSTSDGGFLTIGYQSHTFYWDENPKEPLPRLGLISKYNSAGNIIWTKIYDNTKYPGGWKTFSAATEFSGSYYVVGNTETGKNSGDYGGLIVKFNTSGTVVKEIALGNGGYFFSNVINTTGGLVLAGAGEEESIVGKFDANFNFAWTPGIEGSLNDEFKGITEVTTGFLAAGFSNSNDKDYAGRNKGEDDAIIAKFDKNGNYLWSKNYGGNKEDIFNAIASNGTSYAAVGYTKSTDGDFLGLNPEGKQYAVIYGFEN